MNLKNCSLSEIHQLAEWHQNEAKSAKESIPKLVSQHYQHLLSIETRPLEWISIDAKVVQHRKDNYLDFIVNACINEKYWIKHYLISVKANLWRRALKKEYKIQLSLFPKHQPTTDLLASLMIMNKWNLNECWSFLISFFESKDLSLEVLQSLLEWKSYFDNNSLVDVVDKYCENIKVKHEVFEGSVSINGKWTLTSKDPTYCLKLLDSCKSLKKEHSTRLDLPTIHTLLDSIETEIFESLKNSIKYTSVFDSNRVQISMWNKLAMAICDFYAALNFLEFQNKLKIRIQNWLPNITDDELFKLYFSQTVVREYVKLPQTAQFASLESQPWAFQMNSESSRFPYIPAEVQLDGFTKYEFVTQNPESDFPVTTFKELLPNPSNPVKTDLLKDQRPPSTSSSFSKSMSIERVTQSFQKPSIFKYAKNLFD
eukprot:NODE_355_length_8917_cov_1.682581.p3 type:complete len:427 gc:universal NODE_355_length_8917_cov_1.682581:4559-3279(-)